MYFLRAVKNILSQQALKSIYYAIVHSHFIYGIHIWNCTSQRNLNNLFSKQKTAIRIITGPKYIAHSEPIFKTLNILPLPLLIEYFKLQFFHRYINNALPASFENMWTLNAVRNLPADQQDGRMLLRNFNEFNIPHNRLFSTDSFPLTNLPRTWSTFPDNLIKSSASKGEFSTKLKKFFLNTLNFTYTCARLLCPHCHLRA